MGFIYLLYYDIQPLHKQTGKESFISDSAIWVVVSFALKQLHLAQGDTILAEVSVLLPSLINQLYCLLRDFALLGGHWSI